MFVYGYSQLILHIYLFIVSFSFVTHSILIIICAIQNLLSVFPLLITEILNLFKNNLDFEDLIPILSHPKYDVAKFGLFPQNEFEVDFPEAIQQAVDTPLLQANKMFSTAYI